MNTENKNMPRLRFPSFTGEWVEKKLGEVTIWDKFFQGVPRQLQPEIIRYPYVLANVFSEIERKDGDVLLLSTGNYVGWTTEDLAGDNLCEGEVVTIPWGGTANIKYAKGKFVTADNRIATSSDVTMLNNKFLYYTMFNSQHIIDGFYRGAGIKHPSMFDVLNMLISLPSLAEQQKIAECLTAIDDLIVAQGKKVDALKEHKKGLMQQLFPQQGETIPRLRFPGFTGEWVEKTLGDCFEFRQGVQCPVDLQSLQKKEGDIRFIRIIDLTQPGEPPRYIADPGFTHHISKNDLFMVRYGSPGLVGYGYEGVIANNLFRLLPKFDMCTKFCKYVLTNLQNEIVALSGASTMPAVNFTTLGLLRIVLPHSLAEQQKIAECLSTLDDQIKAESAELDALKEHKKGLMQQLFPQPSK